MDYDLERSRHEEEELRKVFREMFPLSSEHDLPWAPCHIKQFLRDRINQEASDRIFHYQSRIVRILCEISPPKTHVEDMCRIVVEEAKEFRRYKQELERFDDVKKERDEMHDRLSEIGRLVGCNHVNDPDGRVKLVQCVEESLATLPGTGEQTP